MKSIVIAGKLGKDCKLTNGQTPRVNFSVAVDHREKVDGMWEKLTIWFDVVAFGNRYEKLADYLQKGTSVCVSGDFSTRIWQSDSGPRTSLCINANEITLMGSANRGERSQSGSREGGSHDRASGNGSGGDDFGDNDFGDDTPF